MCHSYCIVHGLPFRKECFLELSVDHAPFLPICPCVPRQASAVSLTCHGTVLRSWCSVVICYDDIPSHEVYSYLCSALAPLSLHLQGTYVHIVVYCVVPVHIQCTCMYEPCQSSFLHVLSGWSSVSVVSMVSIYIVYE